MQRPLLSGFTQSASGARLSDKGNPSYANPGVLFRETATTLAQYAEIPTSLLEKVASAGGLSVGDFDLKKKLSDYALTPSWWSSCGSG